MGLLLQLKKIVDWKEIKCFDLYNENIDYKVIGELQDTDYIMNNAFWIGVYPGMSEDMLDYMIKCIYECAA